MSIPIVPWEAGNIPNSIQEELNRRKVNRSFNFTKSEKGDWQSQSGKWDDYKGPMVPWVRFCSNGAGKSAYKQEDGSDYFDKQGFVLFGGKDFYSGYGFPREGSESIIGYMPNGTPHIIENDIRTSNYPIHVPPPEIERISITIQKELYRRATIEWVCFSPKQLEYMTPYFLVPGISCILEWGWNHFDPSSLLDLNNLSLLKQLKTNPYPLYTDYIMKSRGNYDVLLGIVTHFEWNIDGNKIRCKTEITSPDRIYAGLSIDSNVTSNIPDNSKENESSDSRVEVEGSLKTFIRDDLKNIKMVSSFDGLFTSKFLGIELFIQYLQRTYPLKWKEILYGVYFGRDMSSTDVRTKASIQRATISSVAGGTGALPSFERVPSADKVKFDSIDKLYDNKDKDFDRKSQDNTWISMELLIEILNYHSENLKLYKNKPMFKVDISDCVIGGHPNLISTDGDSVLIPNPMAPKYFYGGWGKSAAKNDAEYDKMKNSSNSPPTNFIGKKKSDIEKNEQLSDYRVYEVCWHQPRHCYRDNLDEVINTLKYSKTSTSGNFYGFPFINDFDSGIPNTKLYPSKYSGFLKNIYFSINKLRDIVLDNSTKTFTDIITKVLSVISNSAGGFWDFRLINSTGKYGLNKEESGTMKIVDYRFVSSINGGNVYTFDYFDSDSLLQSIKFTPTLSNAQSIRTMYAETNNPQNRTVISDKNELLDYHFRDRLQLDEVKKEIKSKNKTTTSFKKMMEVLQNISPPEKSFQVTMLVDGKVLVRRLAMPSDELLKLLIDDGDIENNPTYTGIMPGIQAQFTIQGVGGLRTFMMFLVRNLPEPYSHKNIVFRIIDLTENIEGGKWTTTITAGILPLRKHIKDRLGLKG